MSFSYPENVLIYFTQQYYADILNFVVLTLILHWIMYIFDIYLGVSVTHYYEDGGQTDEERLLTRGFSSLMITPFKVIYYFVCVR